MKTVRDIVISRSEPPVNNVGWLKPLSNGAFMLFFFGNKGWTPNAKIAVNLPSTSGLYSAYGCYSFFRMSMIRLRNVYISLFDNGAYNKNVTCVDSGSQISKEYGYDYESLPIDDIVTDEILSGFKGGGGETNIHPNSKGYRQIGKAYYCKIRSWIAGNL